MAPHPELVREYPQPFCLAKPGEEYVLYLRYAGTVKLQMDDASASQKFRYNWYNPSTGKVYDSNTVLGKNILQFNCPESYPGVAEYKDWVLYIKRDR